MKINDLEKMVKMKKEHDSVCDYLSDMQGLISASKCAVTIEGPRVGGGINFAYISNDEKNIITSCLTESGRVKIHNIVRDDLITRKMNLEQMMRDAGLEI